MPLGSFSLFNMHLFEINRIWNFAFCIGLSALYVPIYMYIHTWCVILTTPHPNSPTQLQRLLTYQCAALINNELFSSHDRVSWAQCDKVYIVVYVETYVYTSTDVGVIVILQTETGPLPVHTVYAW